MTKLDRTYREPPILPPVSVPGTFMALQTAMQVLNHWTLSEPQLFTLATLAFTDRPVGQVGDTLRDVSAATIRSLERKGWLRSDVNGVDFTREGRAMIVNAVILGS